MADLSYTQRVITRFERGGPAPCLPERVLRKARKGPDLFSPSQLFVYTIRVHYIAIGSARFVFLGLVSTSRVSRRHRSMKYLHIDTQVVRQVPTKSEAADLIGGSKSGLVQSVPRTTGIDL